MRPPRFDWKPLGLGDPPAPNLRGALVYQEPGSPRRLVERIVKRYCADPGILVETCLRAALDPQHPSSIQQAGIEDVRGLVLFRDRVGRAQAWRTTFEYVQTVVGDRMIRSMELGWRLELFGGVRLDFQPVVAIPPGRRYYYYTLWGFLGMSDMQANELKNTLRPFPKQSSREPVGDDEL